MAAFIPLRADLGLSEGYHSPQAEAAVRLNTNESPYPPPAGFLAAVADELQSVPFHRYPDRSAWGLRKAVAELHRVTPEQIWCANGSNEILQTLLLAFGGPGRTAAVFEPTYALHRHICDITATAVVEGERDADFDVPLSELDRVLGQARPDLTFVCSPNNPTGGAVSKEELLAVLERAPGLVVVDEAYGQFAGWSALELVAEDRPLVVTRTYSKTWSMAAMRLGYLVGPSSIVGGMERVALPYHLDVVKQIAGRIALRFTGEMEARVSLLVAERGRLADGLAALDVDAWPSDANFILFRPGHKPGQKVWEDLLSHSVLVRNCSGWPRLANCLRVTVGTPEENTLFLGALAAALA
jgi:histidinol-phosphate aminotransferase